MRQANNPIRSPRILLSLVVPNRQIWGFEETASQENTPGLELMEMVIP
jgi:hypothetical protein